MRLSKVLVTAIFLMFTGLVCAGELDMLIDKLVEKEVITEGEGSQLKFETKEEARKLLAKGESPGVPSWTQKLSLKGDVRLREQCDMTETAVDRYRTRIRFRLGAESGVIDGVKAGFGLASAGIKSATISALGSGVSVTDGEARSTNHTLGDSLSKAALMIDYAYLNYSPAGWINISGGKFANPIYKTTDILWDSDLNTDGIATALNFNVNSDMAVFLNNAAIIMDESSALPDDPMIYCMQPGVSYKIGTASLKAAAAMYMTNVKDYKLDLSAGTNSGASTALTYEYDAISLSAELNFNSVVAGKNIKLFGDSVNTSDPSDDNTGYCGGLTVGDGKISALGQWQLTYMQRKLKADAWIDTLPDSDSYGGATNAKGYEVAATFGLSSVLNLGFDYYNMDKINDASSTTPKSLWQADLVYKF